MTRRRREISCGLTCDQRFILLLWLLMFNHQNRDCGPTGDTVSYSPEHKKQRMVQSAERVRLQETLFIYPVKACPSGDRQPLVVPFFSFPSLSSAIIDPPCIADGGTERGVLLLCSVQSCVGLLIHYCLLQKRRSRVRIADGTVTFALLHDVFTRDSSVLRKGQYQLHFLALFLKTIHKCHLLSIRTTYRETLSTRKL